MHKRRIISRTVLLLSLVSLFTDIASEMLYPVMPLYLKEIGFTVAAIGILEGVAEAVAGLSKGYFGTWSDNIGIRMPFVRWGYGLSAISKPMMAVFSYAWWVFLARTIDRTGKGLRTGARDAILSEEATSETKATVFGFHRSMDTAGAMVGPSLALLFLYFYPAQYKSLFVWALVPGIIAIFITFLIKEKRSAAREHKEYPSFKAFYQYWLKAPAAYKKLTGALLAFALFNSSDVLLLLRMKETGRSDNALIAVYIFYNAVYAVLAYPIGVLADKTSLRKVFVTGLLFFTLVYAGMCTKGNTYWYLFLFFLYGIYAAATEGISKAWITKLVGTEKVATAVGTYTGFQSIAALLASSIAGILWFYFGAIATFMLSAIVTLLVLLYIYFKTE
jgi:MFS family permease